MDSFKALPHYMPGETKENLKNIKVDYLGNTIP
jgi:hypothetical protein